jgi:hypothetical protein
MIPAEGFFASLLYSKKDCLPEAEEKNLDMCNKKSYIIYT